jgi:hypothetical protein
MQTWIQEREKECRNKINNCIKAFIRLNELKHTMYDEHEQLNLHSIKNRINNNI